MLPKIAVFMIDGVNWQTNLPMMTGPVRKLLAYVSNGITTQNTSSGPHTGLADGGAQM
jgi:hypothetical protein